jgi:hypothetical protein
MSYHVTSPDVNVHKPAFFLLHALKLIARPGLRRAAAR